MSLLKRTVAFIGILSIWFVFCYYVNSSYTDAIEQSENLKLLWILSTLFAAVLANFCFRKKKS